MLQNAYLVAKIGVDTAENEPIEKSDVSWLETRVARATGTDRRRSGPCLRRHDERRSPRQLADLDALAGTKSTSNLGVVFLDQERQHIGSTHFFKFQK